MSLIHRARASFEALPVPARHLVGSFARHLPVRARYGKIFSDTIHELRSTDRLGPDEVAVLAQQRLSEHLLALQGAPYCADVLREAGLRPEDVSAADLAHLPMCSKSDVLESPERFVVSPAPAASKWVTTAGSTGEPLGFWLDKDASVRDWAYTVCAWSRVGYRLDDPRVVLRGVPIGGGTGLGIFAEEPLRRELYVSVFDLDRAHFPEIQARIAAFRPRFIHGYPSAIDALAEGYISSAEPPPDIDALLLASESVPDQLRQRVEDAFGVRAFSFYGMSEKLVFAAECEFSTQLHVEPLYGICELVDSLGRTIHEPGVIGEVVATGFLNRATALIRYRTGDYASWAAGGCRCGRGHRRLATVDGRLQEYLVTSSGAFVSMAALNMHDDVTKDVLRFQFVQREPGFARLLVMKTAGSDAEIPAAFVAALHKKLGAGMKLAPEVVESIPLSSRGKHRYVIREGAE